MSDKKGKVIIVGAGPGAPGFLTIRGREAIEVADVIVYDYLANPAFLNFAKPGAEKIYVGKKGGDHTMKQPDINQLIVDKAKQGNVVTRLKGGDPYIFGRGSEEADFVDKNGIAFEVVAGIPAAIGAAATAGIPLTDRRHTSTLAFVTGHEDPTKPESSISWEHLSRGVGTIVFYMGVKNLPDIANKLMENGRPSTTPVSLVEWATTPRQRVVTGKLENIAALAKENNIHPPTLIIVGEVNELATNLNWFEARPLYGKTVIVTRSRKQASALLSGLLELGANAVEMPAIDIVPPEDWTEMDVAIGNVSSFDWMIFTSVNGVEIFFRRMLEKGLDARSLAGAKIAAIGPATAARLESFGIRPDFQPEKYVAESVAEGLASVDSLKGRKMLLPRADIARKALPELLAREGAEITEITAYNTVPGDFDVEIMRAMISAGEVDAVTFTSSSTARNFVDRLGKDFIMDNRDKFAAVSIGPITSDTLRELGLEPASEADEFTIPGLTEKLIEYFNK